MEKTPLELAAEKYSDSIHGDNYITELTTFTIRDFLAGAQHMEGLLTPELESTRKSLDSALAEIAKLTSQLNASKPIDPEVKRYFLVMYSAQRLNGDICIATMSFVHNEFPSYIKIYQHLPKNVDHDSTIVTGIYEFRNEADFLSWRNQSKPIAE